MEPTDVVLAGVRTADLEAFIHFRSHPYRAVFRYPGIPLLPEGVLVIELFYRFPIIRISAHFI